AGSGRSSDARTVGAPSVGRCCSPGSTDQHRSDHQENASDSYRPRSVRHRVRLHPHRCSDHDRKAQDRQCESQPREHAQPVHLSSYRFSLTYLVVPLYHIPTSRQAHLLPLGDDLADQLRQVDEPFHPDVWVELVILQRGAGAQVMQIRARPVVSHEGLDGGLDQLLHLAGHHLGSITLEHQRSSSSPSTTSTRSPCSWASEMTSLSAFQMLVRFSSGTPSPVIVQRIFFSGPIVLSSRSCSRKPGQIFQCSCSTSIPIPGTSAKHCLHVRNFPLTTAAHLPLYSHTTAPRTLRGSTVRCAAPATTPTAPPRRRPWPASPVP